MTDTIPADGLDRPARTWAVLSVAIAITLTVLDSSIANVALPVIAHDFGAKPSEAIWIVNGYQLAIVVALLPLAALSELIGFRRVYVAGLAVFAVASIACALSRGLPALTAARALQGLGAAGVMSVNGGLIRFIWPSRLLGRGIGLNAVVISIAAAVGPSLASAILALGPWPWLFAVNVPIALIALALAARVLPANPLSKRRFDWISAGLNAATFGALISGVDLLTRTPNVIAGGILTAIGVGTGTVLARREWSRPTPLVPFDLLRIRIFGLSVATSIAAFAAQTSRLRFAALSLRGHAASRTGADGSASDAMAGGAGCGGPCRGLVVRQGLGRRALRDRARNAGRGPGRPGRARQRRDDAGHRLAHGAVRPGFRSLPDPQQPHDADLGAA